MARYDIVTDGTVPRSLHLAAQEHLLAAVGELGLPMVPRIEWCRFIAGGDHQARTMFWGEVGWHDEIKINVAVPDDHLRTTVRHEAFHCWQFYSKRIFDGGNKDPAFRAEIEREAEAFASLGSAVPAPPETVCGLEFTSLRQECVL